MRKTREVGSETADENLSLRAKLLQTHLESIGCAVTLEQAEEALRLCMSQRAEARATVRGLEATNRALVTLSRCTELARRASDENALLQGVCDVVVAQAGYALAWVGLADPGPGRRVIPAAKSGDTGYLLQIDVTWDESECGRGPAGVAIRERRAVVLRDSLRDPDYLPWRAAAQRYGYRSAIALPLCVDGEAIGMLGIYSPQPDAFDDEEVTLLERLANTTAFGLAALREHQRHLQAEAALRESEERFRATFECAPIGIAHTAPDGRMLFVNRRLCEIGGYSREELLRLTFQDLTHPDDVEENVRRQRAVVAGEIPQYSMEKRYRRKDGSYIWTNVTVSLLRDQDGGPKYVVALLEDISERRRAADALRAREAQLAEAQRIAHLGSWEQDIATGVSVWSDEMYRLLGHAPGTVEGAYERYRAGVHAEDRAMVDAAVAGTLRGETGAFHLDHRLIPAGGGQRTVHIEGRLEYGPEGRAVRMIGTVLDITERERAVAAVRESERKFRLVANAAAALIAIIQDGRVVYFNAAALAYLGYSAHELVDMNVMTVVHPDHRPMVQRHAEARPAGRGAPGQYDIKLLMRNGDTRWVHLAPAYIEYAGRPAILATAFDVTDKKKAEQREVLFVQQTPLGVIEWDRDFRVLSWNPAAQRIFGYSPEEAIGRHAADLLVPQTARRQVGRTMAALRAGAGREPTTSQNVTRDGRLIDCEWYNTQLLDEDGGPVGYASLVQDVTDRHSALRALADSEAKYRVLVESAHELILVVQDDLVRFANARAASVFGCDRGDLTGRCVFDLLHPDDAGTARERHHARLRGEGPAPVPSVRVVCRDGSLRWMDTNSIRIAWEGRPAVLVFMTDITDRVQAETRLSFLASHDPVTELPNRARLIDRADHALRIAQRLKRQVAILCLDLDRFRAINDSFGHAVGDEVLKRVGQRLVAAVRASDTVARLAGEEFGVLLEGISAPEDAAQAARHIRDAFIEPLRVGDQQVFVTASVGISIYPEDGADAEALLRNAYSALEKAKETGKNTYVFFTEDMNSRSIERLALEGGLRGALDRGEYVLHYQPRVDIATGRVIGAEALLRWQHAQIGLVYPGKFIPLLEDTGLIIPVGKWVIRDACRQHVEWRDRLGVSTYLSVNLSARQLNDPSLPHWIGEAVQETGIDPRYLELEITESVLMRQAEETLDVLHSLKSIGLSLAIDDFGTGYSSLSYLRHFPIDVIKIDQSFVRDVVVDRDSLAITRSIVALARSLNMQVVAEGVETPEQLAVILSERCDQAQGYHFSRPVAAEAFAALLGAGPLPWAAAPAGRADG